MNFEVQSKEEIEEFIVSTYAITFDDRYNKEQTWIYLVYKGTLKGETALETLERETMEELGVKLDVSNAVKLIYYKTGNVWMDEYLVKQDIDLSQIVMQKEEVSEVKYATYDEINELFENNMFIKDRWEFVKEKIKEYIDQM